MTTTLPTPDLYAYIAHAKVGPNAYVPPNAPFTVERPDQPCMEDPRAIPAIRRAVQATESGRPAVLEFMSKVEIFVLEIRCDRALARFAEKIALEDVDAAVGAVASVDVAVIVDKERPSMRVNRRYVALALSALLLAFARAAHAQETPVVRVIALPIDSGAEPYLAESLGFFKKAGIDVEINGAGCNGASIAAAVASGSADIGQSNVVSIAAARERDLPFVIIAGSKLFVAEQHQNALVVASNSPIRSAHDFDGKTIAVPGLQEISTVGVEAWVDANGGHSSSIKLIEMPFASMAAAVTAGRIDAADLPEPQLDDALATKTVRVVADPYEAIAKKFLVGCWFTTTTWAKAHPDLVRAYASAMAQTAEWANAHPAQTAAMLARIMKSPKPIPVSALPEYATHVDPGQIQPLLNASAKYGILKTALAAEELTLNAR